MGENKATEDLAYVRNALERQRRLACEFIPVWFAGVIAFYFLCVSAVKDMAGLGIITENAQGNFKDVAFILLMGTFVVLFLHARKSRKTSGAEPQKPSRAETIYMAIPAVILIGGVMYQVLLSKVLGIDNLVARPFILTQLAFMMMLVGFKTIRAVFWFGLGLAVGGVWLFMLSDGFAYANSILALIVSGFFLFGAWREQRAGQA